MDIYDNSDCRVEPKDAEVTFDADAFVWEWCEWASSGDGIEMASTISLVQAAYDQGRADEAAKAKGDTSCAK